MAWLVALIVVVEVGLSQLLPAEPGRHEVDRRIAELEAVDEPPRVVLLSDSVTYGAFLPGDLPEDVLDLSTNMEIGVAGNAFLMRRLFERFPDEDAWKGARVVYVVTPIPLEVDLDSTTLTKPYFTTVFTRRDEIDAVERLLERPELVEAMAAARADQSMRPPSYARRGVFHDPIGRFARASGRSLRGPREAGEVARRTIEELSARTTFEPSPVTEAFLPELAALCRSRGATLEIVEGPLPPTLRDAWKRSGFLAAVAAWWDANPDVRRIDVPEARTFPDAAFYDGWHLETMSREAWGQALLRSALDPSRTAVRSTSAPSSL